MTQDDKNQRKISECIYTIIKSYICIDYLPCKQIKLGKITVGYRQGETFNRILGIIILDLFMNL